MAKSCPTLVTPWTVAHQVPLSIGFPSKNTGVGCHFLLKGILILNHFRFLWGEKLNFWKQKETQITAMGIWGMNSEKINEMVFMECSCFFWEDCPQSVGYRPKSEVWSVKETTVMQLGEFLVFWSTFSLWESFLYSNIPALSLHLFLFSFIREINCIL